MTRYRVVCPKLFNAKNYRTKYFGHEIFAIYGNLPMMVHVHVLNIL